MLRSSSESEQEQDVQFLKHVRSCRQHITSLPAAIMQKLPNGWTADSLREVKLFTDELKALDCSVEVDIRSSSLSQSGFCELIRTLPPNVRKVGCYDLQLANCGPAIRQCIAQNTLEQLSMCSCKIADAAAKEIGLGLRENSGLLVLNLYRNDITDRGLGEIIDALVANKQTGLQKLRVSNNKISPLGVKAFLASVVVGRAHLPLIVVDLSGNVSDAAALKDIDEISKALAENLRIQQRKQALQHIQDNLVDAVYFPYLADLIIDFSQDFDVTLPPQGGSAVFKV